MTTVISVENLSKSYRLGQIGSGTFSNDLKLWWAKARGKPNPLLKIGEADHGNRDGEELWALRDVSFTVQQGEVLGIIGKNGAGKSTLLKILSRVTAPTTGKIKVKGRVASLLEVGTGFHPDLTGRENVYLNGAILGMNRKEIARKFDEIVDFAEVEKFIDTPVKRYSSGMYVRLAFAVAAHLDPEILVVDEVLAVGDARFQKKCLGKMGDVAKEGRTVLFVSHNMAAVSSLCSQCLLLDKGQVETSGETGSVINSYLAATDNMSLTSLKLREDRVGNGRVRLEEISFRSVNANGELIPSIVSGLALQVVLTCRTSKPELLKNVPIYMRFVDTFDAKLFACSTDFVVSGESAEVNGIFKAICSIERLPLMAGLYRVDVFIGNKGVAFDYILKAGEFQVVESDFFGSGKLPDPTKHGIFLVEQKWDVLS